MLWHNLIRLGWVQRMMVFLDDSDDDDDDEIQQKVGASGEQAKQSAPAPEASTPVEVCTFSGLEQQSPHQLTLLCCHVDS